MIWLSCWELWALPLTVSAVSHSSLPLWSSPLLGEPYPQHFHTGSIQHLLWNGKRIFYMTSQRKNCYLLAQLSSFLSDQFSNIMNKNSVCLIVDKGYKASTMKSSVPHHTLRFLRCRSPRPRVPWRGCWPWLPSAPAPSPPSPAGRTPDQSADGPSPSPSRSEPTNSSQSLPGQLLTFRPKAQKSYSRINTFSVAQYITKTGFH